MKLLFCTVCGSVFSLSPIKEKRCDCGTVTGRYDTNSRTAVTNGEGIALGMGTGALRSAIYNLACEGEKFNRKFYQENCQVITWVRPNSGNGNPNTRVEEDEQTKT